MSHLEKYGLELLKNNPNIRKSRKFGIIDNYQEFSKSIIPELNLDIDLEKHNIVITKKINQKGFFMKWHIDDAQLIKHKPNQIVDDKQIFIYNKHYLSYNGKNPPEYTCLIYDSVYNKDFTGGILEFADKTIVKPDKGMYVFFDSREVHKVNPIKSGIRINYLIKFYYI